MNIKLYFIICITVVILIVITGKNEKNISPLISTGGSLAAAASTKYIFATKWGSKGNGNGQFGGDIRPAIDKSGYIYVADIDNNRIQKFSSSGKFITKWGSKGSGAGQFQFEGFGAICVDIDGNIYTFENSINRIQIFNCKGKFITKWRPKCDGIDIAVDHNKNVYVSCGCDIEKYNIQGNLIKRWRVDFSVTDIYPKNIVCNIIMDPKGNIIALRGINLPCLVGNPPTPAGYIMCYDIWKFNSNGTLINQWEIGFNYYPIITGMTVDSKNNIYFSDSGNHCVWKFNSSGKFIAKCGSEGSKDGEFRNPRDITVDSKGYIYVAEGGSVKITEAVLKELPKEINSTYLKSLLNREFITKKELTDLLTGSRFSSEHIQIILSHVVDSGNYRIQKFKIAQ